MTTVQIKKYLFDNAITDFSKFIMGHLADQVQYIHKWDYGIAQPDEEDLPSQVSSDTWHEDYIQINKSTELKTMENEFLSFCDDLRGDSSHLKMTCEEAIDSISLLGLQVTRHEKTLEYLIFDCELRRLGGLNWYDTCLWHSDI